MRDGCEPPPPLIGARRAPLHRRGAVTSTFSNGRCGYPQVSRALFSIACQLCPTLHRAGGAPMAASDQHIRGGRSDPSYSLDVVCPHDLERQQTHARFRTSCGTPACLRLVGGSGPATLPPLALGRVGGLDRAKRWHLLPQFAAEVSSPRHPAVARRPDQHFL